MSQYIVQGIFAVAGIISLLAAILDWDWFFTAQNTQFVVRNVGRRQARWFYGVLGMILIGTAVFFFLNTPPVAQTERLIYNIPEKRKGAGFHPAPFLFHYNPNCELLILQ